MHFDTTDYFLRNSVSRDFLACLAYVGNGLQVKAQDFDGLPIPWNGFEVTNAAAILLAETRRRAFGPQTLSSIYASIPTDIPLGLVPDNKWDAFGIEETLRNSGVRFTKSNCLIEVSDKDTLAAFDFSYATLREKFVALLQKIIWVTNDPDAVAPEHAICPYITGSSKTEEVKASIITVMTTYLDRVHITQDILKPIAGARTYLFDADTRSPELSEEKFNTFRSFRDGSALWGALFYRNGKVFSPYHDAHAMPERWVGYSVSISLYSLLRLAGGYEVE